LDAVWIASKTSLAASLSSLANQALPAVGEAIAAWLQRGRQPGATCPAVFVRLRPPHGQLASTSVSYVVRRACAGLGIALAGAHRLRHTATVSMLAAGGTLAEIGQVLRHARPSTTAIYAKADVLALSPLARPWPRGAR
jgi:integrase/recombinase XerD